MKKLFILIFTLFTFYSFTYSQACLPEGIEFNTQQDIDNFQANYPGCTEIEGDVEISGSDIYNLNSLYVLTSIGGDLLIKSSFNISNLNGLHNLNNVGGNFKIKGMHNLANFEGLNNLTYVAGDFEIEGYNYDLLNFEGFDNLTSIGGNFNIYENYELLSLEGLNSLSSISGNLTIFDNYHLLNLNGLENIDPSSIQNLTITENNSLSTCDVESICQYIVSPNGKITIYENDEGCNSPPQIANNCGITLPCLPNGDYYIFSQSEIDNFQTDYPGCTEIMGNVEITGSDITNLIGLSVVTAISGELLIQDNSSLLDLTGLENLTSIGSHFSIGSAYQDYQALTSLSGLTNLTSIGGQFRIEENDDLTTFSSINNLISIGGSLIIKDNYALTSISGLEGIDSVYSLFIYENASLLNLAGLDNISYSQVFVNIIENGSLTSIENLGSLQSAEWLYISSNPALTNLSGLENLSNVWGLGISDNLALSSLVSLENLFTIYELSIANNDALASLAGLDNINIETLNFLFVTENYMLSDCDIKSICDFLKSSKGAQIYNNATGCNSPEEVEEACLTSINEHLNSESKIRIYPNPAKNTITIVSKSKVNEIRIYNQTGQIVLFQESPANTLDISNIPPGLYFIEVNTKSEKYREKLIIK